VDSHRTGRASGPPVREQVGEVGPGRPPGQVGQDVRQVGPRVESVLPGARTDAHQDGRSRQTAVPADLKPVGPADGDGANGPLRRPVVDGEPSVVQVSDKGWPLISGIPDRLPKQALWRRGAVLLVEPAGEPHRKAG
jgi:hypothetical protein